MKTRLIPGTGVCGLELTLSLGDMFQAGMMADQLDQVIKNHETCKVYERTPCSELAERFPNGRPVRSEVPDEHLNRIFVLLKKMAYATSSTIFEEQDEPGSENSSNI